MIRLVIFSGLLLLASPALAQVSPQLSFDDPRLQTIVYEPGQPIRLVAFPDSALMLVFHSGETIERVVVSDGSAFSAAVVGRGDTIEMAAQRVSAVATMRVETTLRKYTFNLETGEGLAAAYLVRFVPGEGDVRPISEPQTGVATWSYKLKGDRSVLPDVIKDDGHKTFLEWDVGRALPAVFGISPSGKEELVAGYMREDVFVVDRVYSELIFRFDKEKASAMRRNEQD